MKTKKVSLVTLAVTAVVFSGALFRFIADPEGPNLLVVIGAAAVVYLLSLPVYVSGSSSPTPKRFWLTILAQVVIAAAAYALLG